jgi:hypothetical protein
LREISGRPVAAVTVAIGEVSPMAEVASCSSVMAKLLSGSFCFGRMPLLEIAFASRLASMWRLYSKSGAAGKGQVLCRLAKVAKPSRLYHAMVTF